VQAKNIAVVHKIVAGLYTRATNLHLYLTHFVRADSATTTTRRQRQFCYRVSLRPSTRCYCCFT